MAVIRTEAVSVSYCKIRTKRQSKTPDVCFTVSFTINFFLFQHICGILFYIHGQQIDKICFITCLSVISDTVNPVYVLLYTQSALLSPPQMKEICLFEQQVYDFFFFL